MTHALFRTTLPWSACQQRYLSYICEFKSKIIHLPGVENCVAVTLSCPSTARPSFPSTFFLTSAPVFPIFPFLAPVLPSRVLSPEVQLSTLDFEFSTLPLLQLSCSSEQAMLAKPSLQVLPVPYGDSTVLCNVSSCSIHPLVSKYLRKQLFSTLLWISHPGIHASRRLISSWFVWPCMAKNIISLWSQGCIPCQQNKIQTQIKSSVPSILVLGFTLWCTCSVNL